MQNLSHECILPVHLLSMKGTISVLLLGSNAENPDTWIDKGLSLLAQHVEIEKISNYYCSPAWGFDGPDFVNVAVRMTWEKSPDELMQTLLSIEKECGRVRLGSSSGYQNRTLDMDILTYGQEVLATQWVEIPHPRLALRRFALIPLRDVHPDWIHPTLNKSVSALLDECIDKNSVILYSK